MIITTSALNQLENKFTPNGLGIEIITPSTLTYNKITTAINNGLLPVLKTENNENEFSFKMLEQYYYDTYNDKYCVYFKGTQYFSADVNSIMSEEVQSV